MNQTASNSSAFARDEEGNYQASRPVSADDVLELARNILAERVHRGTVISSPREAEQYISLRLAPREHEMFAILWLDNRHGVIAFEELFTGTIDGCSVHAREVVKRALANNAAACILAHNHPSGNPEPSAADQTITRRIKEALGLVDVRVLDHLIAAGGGVSSMAELGMV
ncbi:RadC family protein [Acidihalobacter prosperus]|uniref:MPN domain-containing protein n=1 Tax=Acidihalobacter prosperus TaxID=160660 RepID=A0A1A6C0Z0_9GAMM|nr:DNA repair protein RadC [Acidihalobacter prosperus]OBS08232.1 hypothetical protein Thpro_022482 [Acidihalobacter prosperus]